MSRAAARFARPADLAVMLAGWAAIAWQVRDMLAAAAQVIGRLAS